MKNVNLTLKKTLVPIALVASLAATQVAGLDMGFALNEGYSITASATDSGVTANVTASEAGALSDNIVLGALTDLTDAMNGKAYAVLASDDDVTKENVATKSVFTDGATVEFDNGTSNLVIKNTVTVKANTASGTYKVYVVNNNALVEIGDITFTVNGVAPACTAANLTIENKTVTMAEDAVKAEITLKKADGVGDADSNKITVKKGETTLAGTGTDPTVAVDGLKITLTWAAAPTEDADFTVFYDSNPVGGTADETNKVTVKKYSESAPAEEGDKEISAASNVKAGNLKFVGEFDYFAKDTAVAEGDFKYTVKEGFKASTVAGYTFKDAKGNAVTGVTLGTVTATTGEVTVPFTVKKTVAKQKINVFYGAVKVGTIDYSSKATIQEKNEDKGTHIIEAGSGDEKTYSLKYDGDATTLDIPATISYYEKATDTKPKSVTLTGITSTGDATTVILPEGIKTIAKGAFNPTGTRTTGEGQDVVTEKIPATVYIPRGVTFEGSITEGKTHEFYFSENVKVKCLTETMGSLKEFFWADGHNTTQDNESGPAEYTQTDFVKIGDGGRVLASTDVLTSSKGVVEDIRENVLTIREGDTADTTEWVCYNPGTTKSAGKLVKVDGDKATFTNSTMFTKNFDLVLTDKKADPVTKTKKIYKIVNVSVMPELPTEWKVGTAPKTGTWAAGTGNNYTLSIEEGKAFKIPLSLKNGKDKTITYTVADATTGSSEFSVVNGTVKAIKAGTARNITVKAAATGNNPEGWTLAPNLTIAVTVTAKAPTKFVTSASALTLEKPLTGNNGIPQTFTVMPDSMGKTAGTGTMKINADDAPNYEYKINNGTFAPFVKNENVDISGYDTISVRIKNGYETFKAKSVNLELTLGQKTTKVKLNAVDNGKKMYAMVSGFKATSAKKSIDIPIGTNYKINMAVNPATADNRFNWSYKTDENGTNEYKPLGTTVANLTSTEIEALKRAVNGDPAGYELESNASINYDTGTKEWKKTIAGSAEAPAELNDTAVGNLITEYNNRIAAKTTNVLEVGGTTLVAKSAGTVYIQAQTLIGWGLLSANGNDMVPCATSDIYTVNVYDPAASTAYPSLTPPKEIAAYTFQGGFLIGKEESQKNGEHEFTTGGTPVVMLEPTVGDGKEEVEWTSNNPIALSVEDTQTPYEITPANATTGAPAVTGLKDTLTLRFNSPGTYTVTGTTKYTKQKFTFKVLVATPAKDDWAGKDATATSVKAQLYKEASNRWDDITEASVINGDGITAGTEAAYKVRLDVNLDNAGGKIKMESDDRGITVNAKTGEIKVTKKATAGEHVIKMTLANSKNAGEKIERTFKVKIVAATTPATT